jgi:hypothetical protein
VAEEEAVAAEESVTAEMTAMLKQFEPLLQAIVVVARGDESQRHHVELFLPTLEAQDWHLSDAVQRIWAGERDVAALRGIHLRRDTLQFVIPESFCGMTEKRKAGVVFL